jgi:hypothetical protein
MSGDGFDNDDDDDDEGSDFDIDETDLESYSTVLEANEDIDEFQIFCESLQSTSFPKPHSSLKFSIFFCLKNFNWIQLVIIKPYYKLLHPNNLHKSKT